MGKHIENLMINLYDKSKQILCKFKGRMKMFQITACLHEFDHYKGLKYMNPVPKYFQFYDYLYLNMDKFDNFTEISEILAWKFPDAVKYFRIGSKLLTTTRNLWEPIFDMEFGICYYFNPKNFGLDLVSFEEAFVTSSVTEKTIFQLALNVR